MNEQLEANRLRDIERLDAHIDKMLEPGQDKGKEERIIRAGYVAHIKI